MPRLSHVQQAGHDQLTSCAVAHARQSRALREASLADLVDTQRRRQYRSPTVVDAQPCSMFDDDPVDAHGNVARWRST
jgi:hypothetical protein